MYNGDNDRRLMTWFGPGTYSGSRHMEWIRAILPYMDDDPDRYNCWATGSVDTWCYPSSQDTVVYRANRTFVCPSNDRTHNGLPWAPGWNRVYWISYGAHVRILGWYPSQDPQRANWRCTRGLDPKTDFWRYKTLGTGVYAIVAEKYNASSYGCNLYSDDPRTDLYHDLHADRNNFLLDTGSVQSAYCPYPDATLRDNTYNQKW